MARAKRLIIGLGNPGEKYAGTRHNVGFAVADAVADRAGISLSHEKGNVLLGLGRSRGCSFGVAKPLTFMNRSGSAVRTLIGRFGLSPDEILVVYDDLNLDLGRLRLRPGGSAGGHNGVEDIIHQLSTDQFPRLRVGIGNEYSRGKQVDYVLSPFSTEQMPVIEDAIPRASDAAIEFACRGLVVAMNRFNN